MLLKLELLLLFLFTYHIRFVVSQTWPAWTGLVEKNDNIYNIKFILLNPL